MSKKVNQLKIGVVLSYISIALNLIVNLAYTPIMIRLLGQSEYGLFTLVSSVVSYLNLFSLGFTGSYLRFFSKYKKNDDQLGEAKLNGMFLTLFIALAIVAFITGMTLAQFTAEIFGNNLTQLELTKSKVLMEILVLNLALTFLSSVFDSIISAHEKFLFQKSINILGIIFNPLINLPLLILGFDSIALVLTTTFITIFKFIVNIIYCLKILNIKFHFHNFELHLFKELAFFSLFIFVNMIIDQINWSVDKYILGRVSGTSSVGIYGIGATFSSVIMQLSVAISSVFAPRVNMIESSIEEVKIRDNEFTNLLIKVGRFQYIILLFVTIGFIFFGRSFINWWAGPEYYNSYYVAIFLILPLTIILPHNLGVEIRRAKNKHQMFAIIQFIIVLLNLFISIPLAKYYGAPGSAFGTFIGNMFFIFFMDYYYSEILNLNMKEFYKNIVSLTIGVLPAIIFGLLGLFKSDLIFNFIWALVYSFLYFTFLYFFAANHVEKEMMNKLLHKMKFRK